MSFAACDSDYVEITDQSVIMATTDAACPSGWVEITDNSVKPAYPETGATGDSKGTFGGGMCIVQ